MRTDEFHQDVYGCNGIVSIGGYGVTDVRYSYMNYVVAGNTISDASDNLGVISSDGNTIVFDFEPGSMTWTRKGTVATVHWMAPFPPFASVTCQATVLATCPHSPHTSRTIAARLALSCVQCCGVPVRCWLVGASSHAVAFRSLTVPPLLMCRPPRA